MMKIIDKLAWIEIKDKSILLTKSYGKDVFYVPGGKRDKRETDEEALIREIQEELSVTIDPNTLIFIGIFEAQAHGQPEGVFVKMTCYSGDYFGEMKVNSEIEDISWYKYADKDKVGPVDKLIFDYLKLKGLLE